MARAMRMEAMRYPGQEQQIMEFFRQNPRASDTLRGPIYEEKVVDFVLELAKVEDNVVTPEELAKTSRRAVARLLYFGAGRLAGWTPGRCPLIYAALS